MPGGRGARCGDRVTGVQPNADAHRHLGHVAHAEGAHGAEDVQSHVGDLCRVPVPIPLGQPGGHHVGVPNCLHLRPEFTTERPLPMPLSLIRRPKLR